MTTNEKALYMFGPDKIRMHELSPSMRKAIKGLQKERLDARKELRERLRRRGVVLEARLAKTRKLIWKAEYKLNAFREREEKRRQQEEMKGERILEQMAVMQNGYSSQ